MENSQYSGTTSSMMNDRWSAKYCVPEMVRKGLCSLLSSHKPWSWMLKS